MLRDWDNINKKMDSVQDGISTERPEVDVQLEEAILGAGGDDGEEVEEEIETDMENDETPPTSADVDGNESVGRA